VLRRLKSDAEVALGGFKVNNAVISVPAYFNDSQRRATQKAGELAGLVVHRIIPEPTAAALAFGLGERDETVAVYDLGGGTFDISILRIGHGLFRVKAIGGDTHLGGDDFDHKIVEWIAEQFKAQHGAALPTETDLSLRARLREEAKRAKIALTNAAETSIQLPDLLTADGRALGLEATLTRQKLEELIAPLIEQSLQLIEATLQAAGFVADDISQFLLVGGQTRTPAVKAMLSKRFKRPINDTVKPDEAVSRGAAILGARLRDHLKERINLWEALPLSLGVEIGDGRMDVIIKANEQIPVEKSKSFTNQRDGQEYIRFAIYQGERPIAVQNAYVGQVLLPLTTARRAGEHRIKCLFKVDPNGILTVKAESADVEGKPVEMVFTYGALSAEEIEVHRRAAEAHRDQDALDSRLLQLRKELADLRAAVADRPPADPVVERLGEVEAALNARDAEQASQALSDLLKMI
jgi:molecular chaperone DnaK